jgi:hypothetical protein
MLDMHHFLTLFLFLVLHLVQNFLGLRRFGKIMLTTWPALKMLLLLMQSLALAGDSSSAGDDNTMWL